MTAFLYRVRFVPARQHGSGQLPGLLDMMRHDRARITDWNRDGDGFVLDIETERPVTEDRWASFGLYPKRTGIHVTPRKGTDT